MKVFLCIPTLQYAGAERFVTELALNLDKTRFEVVCVLTNDAGVTGYYQQLQAAGIRIADVSAPGYWQEFRNIRRLLKQEKPDVVHTNVGAMLHMALPVLLYGKCRHYFSVHSMGHRIFGGVKKHIAKWLFHSKKVLPVAIGAEVKRSLCSAYGLPEENIPCVYNGVDTRAFPQKTGETVPGAPCHFITVGRIQRVKNFSLLVSAFAKVLEARPESRLTIVGDGELREEIEQQIQQLDIAGAVHLAGRQSDVASFLQKADVYCVTSLVEGLPVSVLEAMSTGLPVITTPAGGIVDIVKDGENGFLSPHGDIDAFARRMEQLATDTNLRRQMGEDSRRKALALDVKQCARGYEEIYCSGK